MFEEKRMGGMEGMMRNDYGGVFGVVLYAFVFIWSEIGLIGNI
jgi:hypothetical protein